MDGAGDVAIGFAAPAYQLDVYANLSAPVVRIRSDGNAATADVLILQGGTDAGGGGASLIQFNDGDGTVQGAITMTSGASHLRRFYCQSRRDHSRKRQRQRISIRTIMCVDGIAPKDPDSDRAIKYFLVHVIAVLTLPKFSVLTPKNTMRVPISTKFISWETDTSWSMAKTVISKLAT